MDQDENNVATSTKFIANRISPEAKRAIEATASSLKVYILFIHRVIELPEGIHIV